MMRYLILMLMVVAIGLAGCSENPVALERQYDVTYTVGVSAFAWLTLVVYTDEHGELQSVDPPSGSWQYGFWPETVPSGTYLYLAAQGRAPGEAGVLRTEIWVDGEVWRAEEGAVDDVTVVFGTLP